MSTTLATLIREVARDMFPENYVDFTATAGTTTLVTGSELHDDEIDALVYKGGWIGVYGGTGAEQYRRIATYSPEAASTTGTFAPTRPFATAPDTTSTCFAYTGALNPDDLKRYVNKALRRMRRERFLPITLITDGLMETSGVTNWTDTNGTSVKVTSAATVYEGERALQFTNSSTNGYTAAVNVPVVPGQQLALAVVGRITTVSGTATARVRLWDVTNGASIDTESFTARSHVVVWLPGVTVPSGCFEVQLRLGADENSIVTVWDQALLWRLDQQQYVLPSDLANDAEVIAAWSIQMQGGSPLGGRLYEARSLRPRLLPRVAWDILPDPIGVNPYVLDMTRGGLPGGPFGVRAILPWTELSAYTDATNANRDDLNIYARAMAFAYLAETGPRDDRKYYAEQARVLALKVFHHAARQPRPPRPVGRRG